MVLGRVDQWPETIDSSDKPLMVFAILNIIQEYLNTLNIFSMACDKTYFLCMLQPKGIDEESALGRTEKWASKISFVNGMLDSIQNTCRQLLKLPISLVTSGTLTDWKDVSRDFDLLRQEMSKGLGRGHEVILTSRAKHPVAGRSENLYRGNAYNFKLLESYMDSGHEEGFSELCASMLENAFGPVEQYSKYMEVYFGIAMLLLTALNRRELSKAMYENRELDKLMNIDAHITWKAAAEYLNMLAKQMFHSAREDQQGKSNAIAERLNAYIEEHLHEDLSLNRLSEVVYLNPAYVSRLYKQTMGVGLAEIISQKRMHRALDLLVNTPMKIQNVAGEVGLETGYFIKLFKKNMKLTPQEYRESLGNREL
jgi:two-component system response regulator YesN